MKKFVLLSLLLLFAVLGITAAAAVSSGNAVVSAVVLSRCAAEAGAGRTLAPAAPQQQSDDAFFLRCGGDTVNGLICRLNETARPLSARLVLSCFEIARILAEETPRGREFAPVTDSHPQILIWLASYLEVRAGPALA